MIQRQKHHVLYTKRENVSTKKKSSLVERKKILKYILYRNDIFSMLTRTDDAIITAMTVLHKVTQFDGILMKEREHLSMKFISKKFKARHLYR